MIANVAGCNIDITTSRAASGSNGNDRRIASPIFSVEDMRKTSAIIAADHRATFAR